MICRHPFFSGFSTCIVCPAFSSTTNGDKDWPRLPFSASERWVRTLHWKARWCLSSRVFLHMSNRVSGAPRKRALNQQTLKNKNRPSCVWAANSSNFAHESLNGSCCSSTATPWIGARFFVLWAQRPRPEITRSRFLGSREKNGAWRKLF